MIHQRNNANKHFHEMQQICRIYLFFKTKNQNSELRWHQEIFLSLNCCHFSGILVDLCLSEKASLHDLPAKIIFLRLINLQLFSKVKTPSVMIGGVRLKMISISSIVLKRIWRSHIELIPIYRN